MSLAKHFITLLSGRLASQVILVVSTPILTRLYAPEDFGLVSLVNSMTQVPLIYLMGRLDQAIPQSRNDHEAGALATLAFGFSLIITLSAFTLTYLGQDWLDERYHSSHLSSILLAAICMFLLISISKIGKQWATYREQHGVTASADLLQMFFQRGSPLAVYGVLGGGPWSLFSGYIFGTLVSGFIFITRLRRDFVQCLNFNTKELWETLKEYKDFPLFLGATSIVMVLTWSLLSILLADFFGLAAVAWYGQAYALLFLPVSLLTQSSANIFYPRLAQARDHQDKLDQLTKMLSNLSFDLSLYPLFILLPIAPLLWGALLGKSFQMSGEIAQFLIPMAFINMLFSPLSVSVNVFHKQKTFFKQTLLCHSLYLIVFYIGCLSDNILWAFTAFMSVTIIVKIAQIKWFLSIMGVSSKSLISGLLWKCLYTLFWVIGLYILRDIYGLSLLWLMISASAGGLGWFAVVLMYNEEAKTLLRQRGWMNRGQ